MKNDIYSNYLETIEDIFKGLGDSKTQKEEVSDDLTEDYLEDILKEDEVIFTEEPEE